MPMSLGREKFSLNSFRLIKVPSSTFTFHKSDFNKIFIMMGSSGRRQLKSWRLQRQTTRFTFHLNYKFLFAVQLTAWRLRSIVDERSPDVTWNPRIWSSASRKIIIDAFEMIFDVLCKCPWLALSWYDNQWKRQVENYVAIFLKNVMTKVH